MKKTKTVRDLLMTAMAPLGKTLYVYGGGWNYEDTGAGAEARTIGVSSTWETFFRQQTVDYRYKGLNGRCGIDYYPYDGKNRYSHLGLDCSGYIGWVIYNFLQSDWKNSEEDYVVEASEGARTYAEKYQLGNWEMIDMSHLEWKRQEGKQLFPGDIISIPGHIWMYIGSCADNSIVLIHSSVIKSRTGAEGGGVQLSVLNPKGDDSTDCMAYELVDCYVKNHFPEWYTRYKVSVKPWSTYLTGIRFRLSPAILTDQEHYYEMSADDILTNLAADQ